MTGKSAVRRLRHSFFILYPMLLHNPYKDDYDHRPEVNKRGRFVDRFYYKGDLYKLPFDGKKKRKTVLCCILFFLLFVALWVLQGLINQTSSHVLWVLIPYLFVLLPTLFMGLGIAEYAFSHDPMRRDEYEKGLERIKHSVIGAMVLAGIGMITEIVYLVIRRGEYTAGRELLFLLFYPLFIALGICFGRYYDRCFSSITIEKVELEHE